MALLQSLTSLSRCHFHSSRQRSNNNMERLPIEICVEVAKYLLTTDLKVTRTTDRIWNDVSKFVLFRRRDAFDFTFDDIEKLAAFNETFANYKPISDLAHAKFSLKTPVITSGESLLELCGFLLRFHRFVTRLTLDFDKIHYDYEPGPIFSTMEKKSIDKNVNILLAGVRGQLQELELKYFSGLSPSVFGSKAFPNLRILKIHNNCKTTTHDRKQQEDCVLELSRKVPAIKHFAFDPYSFSERDDPDYLPTVLSNLVRVNPEVTCHLRLEVAALTVKARSFLANLRAVPVRLCELHIMIGSAGNPEELRKLFRWIAAQGNWLKKLTLCDPHERLHGTLERTGLKIPSLRALEELDYFQCSAVSFLDFGSADYFPRLRAVATVFTGNDFRVPLPNVNNLTVYLSPYMISSFDRPEDAGRRLLDTFPNIETLTCPEAFTAIPEMFQFPYVTILTIQFTLDVTDYFWNMATRNAPKMTLAQIIALPDCAEAESNINPSFKDLPLLKELRIVDRGVGVDQKLLTLLFLSKKKRLQRLRKLVIHGMRGGEVSERCVENLKTYHDSVQFEM